MDNIDLGSLNYLAIIAGIIINQAIGAAMVWGRGGSPLDGRGGLSRRRTWRR